MAGPNIVSSSPAANDTGVVLGQTISIVFDSLIDHTTLSSATISVSYPAGAGLITPRLLHCPVATDPDRYRAEHPVHGRCPWRRHAILDQVSRSGQSKHTHARGRDRNFRMAMRAGERSQKGGRFRSMEKAKIFCFSFRTPQYALAKKAAEREKIRRSHHVYGSYEPLFLISASLFSR